MYTCIELLYDDPLTQCYLLEFYKNFKLMLTTPKMLETGTKATSTSHQTSSLPETPLSKIQTRPVPKLAKKKQGLYSCFTLKLSVSIVFVPCCIPLQKYFKGFRHTLCIG